MKRNFERGDHAARGGAREFQTTVRAVEMFQPRACVRQPDAAVERARQRIAGRARGVRFADEREAGAVVFDLQPESAAAV